MTQESEVLHQYGLLPLNLYRVVKAILTKLEMLFLRRGFTKSGGLKAYGNSKGSRLWFLLF